MNPITTKVDMHCHSTASQVPTLGVQGQVGLPECATPPEEVYALAKRRGMDFVTITDHDTIAGALEIADRPDVFISEELTVSLRGTDAAAHVLCYGITAADHEWLQAHRSDVERCAAYLHENEIVCALAHPYYNVAAPLTSAQRKLLAELFGIWEVRNGARSWALNAPAADFVAARGATGIGGSDDHGGVDIGRTWTEAPTARTPAEFLAHVAAGRISAGGSQGSPAKWAHSAVALATRVLGAEADPDPKPLDPRAVLTIAARLIRGGEAHDAGLAGELSPADGRALLRSWLAAMELDHLDGWALIAMMQADGFSHSDLFRGACRLHEKGLGTAVDSAKGTIMRSPETGGESYASSADLAAAANRVFESFVPVIPYAASASVQAGETTRLSRRHLTEESPRVAILVDGIGATHGVTRVIEEIRQRGVPGFDVEVVGTDADVDRRISSPSEVELPYFPGVRVGVPTLPGTVQALTEGNFDLVHACSPGPVGIAGAMMGRALGVPLVGSHHTELVAYTSLRTGQRELAEAMAAVMRAFYNACELVLSPSPAADRALEELDVPLGKLVRWERGVDTRRFSPTLRTPGLLPEGSINVLYSGRIEREKGIELLADAFLAARAQEPALQLVVAGGGAGEDYLRERLGDTATFLGWLRGDELARVYASADMFVFPSATDTFGQVVIEAQASGLPIAAVAAGGPLTLIEDRASGLLCAPSPEAMAGAILELSRSTFLCNRLAKAAVAAARKRSWERALDRLAFAYRRGLGLSRDTVATGAREAIMGAGATASPPLAAVIERPATEPPVGGRRAA